MCFGASVEGIEELAVGLLVDAISFILAQSVDPMIAPVMMLRHDEAVEIARVAVVHFCFVDCLVAILN